jgi:quinoprotein glucose dehydrogenase
MFRIKKFIKIFILITFLFFVFTAYSIISSTCRSINILISIKDLGFNQLYECVSISIIKNNVKNYLKDDLYLFSLARKIYSEKIHNYDLNLYNPTIKNSDNEHEFSLNSDNKGLINNDRRNDKNIEKITDETKSWLRSHGGNQNLKYNDSKFINKENIRNLNLAWSHQSIRDGQLSKKYRQNIELNPIYINKKIIYVSSDWKIIALNALDGKKIWEIQSLHQPSRRGIVAEYNEKERTEFIYFPIGRSVYKINASNGKIIKEFNGTGFIKATTVIAPIIYEQYLLIITYDTKKLLVFDKNKGNFLWSIPIHPNRNFSGGSPWGGAAFDDIKGIVYVTTGNPQPGLYGVNRPGANKNSASIIAISIKEKKIIWNFQETIHDLWDFDIASPPIIHNLKINDKTYEVVIALTKRGNTLILERNIGKPIFDITYVEVPKSKILGEKSSTYQLKITTPEPFSKIEYLESDFNKLEEKDQREVRKIYNNSKHGFFETPDFTKDLITFGLHGGAEWQGGALDPLNQHLYVPVNNVPYILRPYLQSKETKTFFPKELNNAHSIYKNQCASCHGTFRNGLKVKNGEKLISHIPSLVGFYSAPELKNKFPSFKDLLKKHKELNLSKNDFEDLKKLFKFWDNELLLKKNIVVESNGNAWHAFRTSSDLPASNPPYGYIAKIDLVNGKVIWKSTLGYKQINKKYLKIGTENFGGLAINSAGLIFVTGSEDNKAYVYDGKSGDELWSFTMEAAGSAPPILFSVDGKQYVSFLSTGGQYFNYKDKGSTLYTFTIN